MANTIRGPLEGIIDRDTMKLVGVRLAGSSSPDIYPTTFDEAKVVLRGGGAMAGYVQDAHSVGAQGRRWSSRGLNVFWDFRENAGTVCKDLFAAIPLTLVGSGTFWGVVNGLFLSRAPILAAQVAKTHPQALLRRIFDLSRLTTEKALTVYGILSHPAPWSGSNNTLMCWGLMGNNTTGGTRAGGWSLKLRTTGLLTFTSYAPGMSAAAALTLNDDSPWSGNGNGQSGGGANATTNTLTAFAVQFSRSSAPNCLQIDTFRRQLATKEPPDTQQYNHKSFYLGSNGATSEVSWNAGASLLLGAETGNDDAYANMTNGIEQNLPTGLSCFGANVSPRDPGLMVRIVRDLERSARNFPASLTV